MSAHPCPQQRCSHQPRVEATQPDKAWRAHAVGEGNGTPLQCSCLENPMDGGAWRPAVPGVTELDATERLHTYMQWSILSFCSAAQSCPTLCDPMDCSLLGSPVLYYLPELAQTHVHRVGDAIQPAHPLPPPSPPAFDLSQHQGLF